MFIAAERSFAAGNDGEAAARLKSNHDGKIRHAVEGKTSEPLGRCKNGFRPLPSLKG
jgi:hypothetical protein